MRLLHRAIFFAAQAEPLFAAFSCSNVRTECAYYPKHRKLVVVNNGDRRGGDPRHARPEGRSVDVRVEPYGHAIVEV